MRRGNRRGQAMLLATLTLGGAILGATTIAGLLMLYQLQAATAAKESAAAIFAADAGVEWALFNFYCDLAAPSRCVITAGSDLPLPGNSPGTLSNGAIVSPICYDSSSMPTNCTNTSTAVEAISKGTQLNSKRAFYLNLVGATSTFP